jgi:hypothetical protein
MSGLTKSRVGIKDRKMNDPKNTDPIATNVVIRVTKDYDKFRALPGNRQRYDFHVEQVATAMELFPQLTPAQPILVNEKFQIIDGQHTFMAIKQRGDLVYYIQVEDLGVAEARVLNVLPRKWEPIDYAESYAAGGNENYKEYLKARRDFRQPHNVTMNALGGRVAGKHSVTLNQPFKLGQYEAKNIEHGRYLLNCITEVKELSGVPVITPFAYAIIRAVEHPDFDFGVFLNKLRRHGGLYLQRFTQIQDYLRAIEAIYNVNETKKIRLG